MTMSLLLSSVRSQRRAEGFFSHAATQDYRICAFSSAKEKAQGLRALASPSNHVVSPKHLKLQF